MRYDGRNIAYLHLGKPSNLEKCFAIPLVRNYGENILCILDKFDLQRRVFLSSLDSFLREENRKVYVLAEENDEFYHKMWETLQNRSRENTALEVYSDYGQICDAVRRLSEELVDRRSHQKKEEILIFWMGLESMLKEFSYYPAFRRITAEGKIHRMIWKRDWRLKWLLSWEKRNRRKKKRKRNYSMQPPTS